MIRTISMQLLALALSALSMSAEPSVASFAGGPSIRFAEEQYDFGRQPTTGLLHHDFVFTNRGDALLEITNVETSCDCTTPGPWSRQVSPGATGVVPLQLDSHNRLGFVQQVLSVMCNDRQHPRVSLLVHVEFIPDIQLSSDYALLQGTVETAAGARASVTITNTRPEPLYLQPPVSTNQAFVATLQTNLTGQEYTLNVRLAEPISAGTFQGIVVLATANTNQPLIQVRVLAAVRPIITVLPRQIQLPAGPLATNLSMSVLLANQGDKPLKPGKPKVNLRGVRTRLEVQEANKVFRVVVEFPKGFVVPAFPAGELMVKTGNPHQPIITVPIVATPGTNQP